MNVLIFSVEKQDNSGLTNIHNTYEVADLLKTEDIPFIMAKGCYKGGTETSYMIPWNRTRQTLVEQLCRDFNQESYLYVDSKGYGGLYDGNSNHLTEVGQWQKIDSIEGIDNYTIIDNKYYTCK